MRTFHLPGGEGGGVSERVAIVAGAGGELGRATAGKLAAAGFTVAARPGLEPAAGPRRGHKLASRSVSVMPGPCPVRMNHSVPNAVRKNSSGMPRKNDCSLIWLAWARMARRL